jgi:hypothetical protein
MVVIVVTSPSQILFVGAVVFGLSVIVVTVGRVVVRVEYR